MTGTVPETDRQAALGELGTSLLAAGYAVTDVDEALRAVIAGQGWSSFTVGVLPGAVLIDSGRSGTSRVYNAGGDSLSFSQSARLAALARDAAGVSLSPTDLIARLGRIRAMPASAGPALAVLGSGLMSAGIAVVFRTTWWAVALDFVLGLAIGGLLLARGGRLGRLAVTPFLAAFAVAAVVYALAPYAQWGPTTLYVVCAPLVVLIPGATITTAVIEMAAGDVVSGGGRFVSGLLTWATLAVGIAVGAAVVGRPVDAAGAIAGSVPGWVVVPALIAMSVGVGLFFDADRWLTAVIAGVLLVTYGVVAASEVFVPAPVASGLAAAVVLPACRILERLRPGWPTAVTFRPAFWLLVPGSLGLVTLSQLSAASGSVASTPAAQVGYTVLAIAIGAQVGGVLSAALPRRRRATGSRE